MAHFSGLALGAYPNPTKYADVVTDHIKTRGPRGGIIMTN